MTALILGCLANSTSAAAKAPVFLKAEASSNGYATVFIGADDRLK